MTSPEGYQGPPISVSLVWAELSNARLEFQRQVEHLIRRIEELDRYGTRGVAELAAELKALRDDVMDLRASAQEEKREIQRERKAQQDAREEERRERVATRRWMIGIGVTIFISLYPAIGFLIIRAMRG